MKQILPYNTLLVIAVALTGLVVFYNLVLRETFSVTVAYTMPAAPKPTAAKTESRPEPEASGDDAEIRYDDNADHEAYGYDETDAVVSVTFPLDLNLATEEELRFIPQVGSVMAQRIVQYRDVLGGYESLDQLKGIKGVGDATFETISAYLIINTDETADNNDNN